VIWEQKGIVKYSLEDIVLKEKKTVRKRGSWGQIVL